MPLASRHPRRPAATTDPDHRGPDTRRLVIVHDYLTQFGGAERVVAGVLRRWPESEVRTLVYGPETTFPDFHDARVVTSTLQALHRHLSHRTMLPLLPVGMRSLRVQEADAILSSSSGWAHAVHVPPGTPHVCYCHTPARWLYDTARYIEDPRAATALAPVLEALRRWDRRAATRPTLYVANSENVRRRIEDTYGRTARVLHPPVDTARFTPTPLPEDGYVLVLSRLLRYKRVDLAIRAAARLGLPVVVAGDGPDRGRLEGCAGPGVRFLGSVSEEQLPGLYAGARVYFQGGEEDFGIAALEANASGRPVVAYGRGGALETVRDGVTGLHFGEQATLPAATALRRAWDRPWDPDTLAAHARRFDLDVFIAGLEAILDEVAPQRPPRRVG